MQCSIFNNYKSAYEFSNLGVKLSDKFNNLVQKTLTLEVMSGHISHWRQPLYLSHALTQEAYHAGLDCGEYQFASYTLLYQSYNRFYQGYNLQKYLEELDSYLTFSRKVKNQPAIDTIIGCQLILANLMHVDNLGKYKDEIEHFEDCKRRQITLFICPYLVLKSQVEYLFNRPQSALKYVLEAKNILADIPGVISVGEHNFYYSLILAAVYPNVTKQEQENYLSQINENQKQLRLMAENSSENFLHKYLLVEAELARIYGKLEAIELYDKAIFKAEENSFVQNEALASELAAKYWLAKGKEDFAQIYLRKAHHCYQIWGATRKVEDLETQYPDLAVAKASNTEQNTTLTTSYTSTNKTALDLITLLKTAQAISSEIVLEKLLASLIKILIENAGAETGFILFVEGEKLKIAASASVNYEQVIVFPKTSVDSFQSLPQTVINFVCSLQQDVILDNAAFSGKFTNDPYIVSRHLKSLLCIPIINQGKLISLLYLENNLITGAFTPERVEVLKILSAQAGIALENALLYSSVERKVWERTQELNEKTLRLEETLSQLQNTQTQLIQSEKMSSLGQLVAGVAHEINNPTSFIYSNIEPAKQYIDDLLLLIRLYQKHYPLPVAEIQTEVDSLDLDFVMSDLLRLLSSMKVGADRIKTIVQSLRNFSRMDEAEFKAVDIHEGIDSTLLILGHRLQKQSDRLQIKIIKEYGDLPLLECYAGQLNQVFMNILVNAVDALEDANIPEASICICTQKVDNNIVIKISDNGPGIPDNLQQRLFDPFFTTKDVGKNTGMGLSLSYQIVTQYHGGSLKCFSTVGNGASFVIEIPMRKNIPHS
ncbi:GAF domain-containing sensor histidine kinase [Dulcicalothrix desertica]|nr:ATP-binding protein [Dulcicalothrix desertica]